MAWTVSSTRNDSCHLCTSGDPPQSASLQQAIQVDGTDKGLLIDFNQIETLQDGTTFDPSKLYGTVYVGPYPFENAEADYRYKRFRRVSSISDGVALRR